MRQLIDAPRKKKQWTEKEEAHLHGKNYRQEAESL